MALAEARAVQGTAGGDQRAVFAALKPKFSHTEIIAALRALTSARAAEAATSEGGDGDDDPFTQDLQSRIDDHEDISSLTVRGLNPLMCELRFRVGFVCRPCPGHRAWFVNRGFV